MPFHDFSGGSIMDLPTKPAGLEFSRAMWGAEINQVLEILRVFV